MDERFKVSFGKLLEMEGRCGNPPANSSEKIRYGITETVARRHSYEGEMKDFTIHMAMDIYWADYWHALRLHDVESWHLCHEIFDCAVNVDAKTAVVWLQECLNILNDNAKRWSSVVVDGILGEKTIEVCNAACGVGQWEKRLIKIFNCVQGNHYKTTCCRHPKNENFIESWLDKRVLF